MVLCVTVTLDNSRTTRTVNTTKMNATKLKATILDTARGRRAEETRRPVAQRPRRISSSFGFTLIELVLVVAIVMITAAFALPMTQSAIANYQLNGAVESATGIIQSTRYQAICERLFVSSRVQRGEQHLSGLERGAARAPVSAT